MLAALVRVLSTEVDWLGAVEAARWTQVLCALSVSLVLVVPGLNGPRSFNLRNRRSKP